MHLCRGGKFLKRTPRKLISCFLERTLGSLYFHFPILESSFMSWRSLRFFPGKIWFLDFWDMSRIKKYAFLEIWTFSQKWLPRANHYAHDTRSEILCRTPVSILLYLSPRPPNLRKTSYYSFLAWMLTLISNWRRRRPNNSGHLAEPCSNVPRNQISRSGNPSLRSIVGCSCSHLHHITFLVEHVLCLGKFLSLSKLDVLHIQ